MFRLSGAPCPGPYRTWLLLGAGGLLGGLLSLQVASGVAELRRSRQLLEQVLVELQVANGRLRESGSPPTRRPEWVAPGRGGCGPRRFPPVIML